MKYIAYTRFPSNNPLYKTFLRPMIDLELKAIGKPIRLKALLDTGADYNLANKQYADLLGLSWNQGRSYSTIGINGTPIQTYFHEIEYEIINLPKSNKKTWVGFVDSPGVGFLLGQTSFFNFFDFRFRRDKGSFSIEVI